VAGDQGYVGVFNRSIRELFYDALRIGLKNPRMVLFFGRALLGQLKAARLRLAWEKRGVHVPPLLIVSVTRRCNLRCKGCYARIHDHSGVEMNDDKLRGVIAEARDLGVSIILLAGGEPLARLGLPELAGAFPRIIFPMFTNGLLIDEATARKLRKLSNIIPVLSLEGEEHETDQRRGAGVHGTVLAKAALLRSEGVFFGVSLTLNRRNFTSITDRGYIAGLTAMGCRLFFFIDYVPVEDGTGDLTLTWAQKEEAARLIPALGKEFGGLFIPFPGDEEKYGGCLAAGRGFIHISPEGRIEPCPFAPFSDAGLGGQSLKEALQSEFLRKIRESGEHLEENGGGCALWAKRDWVQSLLDN
jgi:MoaA/NifB/PqqE/SkfB family radical SAM enzyme